MFNWFVQMHAASDNKCDPLCRKWSEIVTMATDQVVTSESFCTESIEGDSYHSNRLTSHTAMLSKQCPYS